MGFNYDTGGRGTPYLGSTSMFLRKVARLIQAHKELSPLRPLLREALLHEAKVFSTTEGLKKYLKEHPKADKAKHSVEKRSPQKHENVVDGVMNSLKHLQWEDAQDSELRQVLTTSKSPKEIGALAKKHLDSARTEFGKIKDKKVRETVEKEFERVKDRSDFASGKLEERLTKEMDDPDLARSTRDYVEAVTMLNFVREEAARGQ